MREMPRVVLPSPAGLSPKLGPLLEMPLHLLSTEGPRAAFHQCDYVSTGFRNAADNDLEVRSNDVVISSADVSAAADWLEACARVLHLSMH